VMHTMHMDHFRTKMSKVSNTRSAEIIHVCKPSAGLNVSSSPVWADCFLRWTLSLCQRSFLQRSSQHGFQLVEPLITDHYPIIEHFFRSSSSVLHF
ncbi:unnamed protein product, partial [Sphagnum jensenii]